MTNPADHPTVTVDQLLGSREPGKDGYGQNGFQGASSNVPGDKPTTNDFLQVDTTITASAQNRDVPKTQAVPTAFGHRDRNANAVQVPEKNSRK